MFGWFKSKPKVDYNSWKSKTAEEHYKTVQSEWYQPDKLKGEIYEKSVRFQIVIDERVVDEKGAWIACVQEALMQSKESIAMKSGDWYWIEWGPMRRLENWCDVEINGVLWATDFGPKAKVNVDTRKDWIPIEV